MSECGTVERIEDHPAAVTFAIHVPRSEFDPAEEQVIVEHLDLDMRDMGDGILAFADIGGVEDSRFRGLSRATVDGTSTFRIEMTAPKAARGDADSIDTPTVEDGRTFLRYYLDNRDDMKGGMQEFVDGKRDALGEAKERGHGPLVLSAIKNGIEIGDLRKDSEDSDQ